MKTDTLGDLQGLIIHLVRIDYPFGFNSNLKLDNVLYGEYVSKKNIGGAKLSIIK